MKKILICLLLILTIFNLSSFTYEHLEVRDTAYEIIKLARSIGIKENDPIIERAKTIQAEAHQQFLTDRDIIATVIYNEAGYKCSDRHMELVAAVIINRLKSDLFPDTVYEIVTAPKQYHPLYADPNSIYGQLARKSDKWKKCKKIATKALKGEIDCPDNVYYQANFKQGDGEYEIHKTSYSTTYFCYIEEE